MRGMTEQQRNEPNQVLLGTSLTRTLNVNFDPPPSPPPRPQPRAEAPFFITSLIPRRRSGRVIVFVGIRFNCIFRGGPAWGGEAPTSAPTSQSAPMKDQHPGTVPRVANRRLCLRV